MRSFFNADDPDRVSNPAATDDRTAAGIPALETDEPETFHSVDAPLELSLPPGTAMLYVHDGPVMDGVRRLHVAFHFDNRREESRPDDIGQVAVADLSITAISERQTWQLDYEQVREWWAAMPRLAGWLNRLENASGDARLIVWDDTAHQIPWELYYIHHPRNEDDSHWLGEAVQIVRWTAACEHGKVASDGTMLLMEQTGKPTDDFGPLDGHVSLPSMATLQTELARDDLRFALLMLHTSTDSPISGNDFKLGGITVNQLAHWDMKALSTSQPVVILNACNTAKLVPVGPQTPLSTTSFAGVFLRKGASSVIATLSTVGFHHSYEFVDHLLHPEDNDHRLGHLLRLWRRRYARRAKTCAEDYADFFNGFMYVYYGHPDSTLRVTGDDGAVGG